MRRKVLIKGLLVLLLVFILILFSSGTGSEGIVKNALCKRTNAMNDFYLGKWIMLDMSANGYFVNSDGVPLSVLEIRDKFAANEICKFVKTSAVHDNFFSDMQMECLYYKQYFAKNLCYLFVETQNEFSDNKKRLSFIPYNFDLTKNLKYKSFIEEDIPPIGNISILLNAPK